MDRFAISSSRYLSMRHMRRISGKRHRSQARRSPGNSNSFSWTVRNLLTFLRTSQRLRIILRLLNAVHRSLNSQTLVVTQRSSFPVRPHDGQRTRRFVHSPTRLPKTSNISCGNGWARLLNGDSVRSLYGSAHPALASTGCMSGSIQRQNITLMILTGGHQGAPVTDGTHEMFGLAAFLFDAAYYVSTGPLIHFQLDHAAGLRFLQQVVERAKSIVGFVKLRHTAFQCLFDH